VRAVPAHPGYVELEFLCPRGIYCILFSPSCCWVLSLRSLAWRPAENVSSKSMSGFCMAGGGLDIINLAVDVDAFCCPEPLFFGTCTFYNGAVYKIVLHCLVLTILPFPTRPSAHSNLCLLMVHRKTWYCREASGVHKWKRVVIYHKFKRRRAGLQRERTTCLASRAKRRRPREGRKRREGEGRRGAWVSRGVRGGDASGHEVSLVTAASNGYQENPILMRELNIAFDLCLSVRESLQRCIGAEC